jgi:predicted DNA-binding protein
MGVVRRRRFTRAVSLKLTDEQYCMLKRLAEEFEGNINMMIRRWIQEKYIEKYNKEPCTSG